MKKIFTLIITLLGIGMGLHAAPSIQRVEPLSWWTNMQCPLTLMFYGEDLADAEVTVKALKPEDKKAPFDARGMQVKGTRAAVSKNYLFVDMDVRAAGTYRITLKVGKKSVSYDYVIADRDPAKKTKPSFSTGDMIYLLMPDRFVDGDFSNNSVSTMQEKGNKEDVNGRFGGDISGIMSQLDRIAELGATAIWSTPLLMDNEANYSYHGYACSDYYHIDPRYGSNEMYRQLVAEAHAKGLKIIMDMVPNHCGSTHWWMKDMPYPNWCTMWKEYTVTNNIFSAYYDIHASQYDHQLNSGGWFDHPMPDMNFLLPEVVKYFQQWAIWWIEYADLDGLRVDTYPYLEPEAGAAWLKAIREEYPTMNIVGECWTRPASAVAYWQDGVENKNGFRSYLPTVMDFPVEEAIRQALENDGTGWGNGTMKIYDAIAQDYLYADVNRIMLMLGNHDMDRIADVVKDGNFNRIKIANVLLATLRGIPQVFAGDEYAVRSSDRSKGHSTLRRPLPMPGELNTAQKDMFAFQSRLFQFRKAEPILHDGKMMHFGSRDNTYAYFRYTEDGAIFVYINASEQDRTIPTEHYAEILGKYNPIGTDILTGKTINLSKTTLVQGPLSALVVKLSK